MNEQKQREAMAGLEGIQVVKARGTNVVLFYRGRGESLREVHPNYDSHDDVQRVIDGLDDHYQIRYIEELCNILDIHCPWDLLPMQGDPASWAFDIANATPAQKREAILRAKGLWEES